jgi:DNA/RNA-binding domain of Phe-tRNA-synthetase-like protein
MVYKLCRYLVHMQIAIDPHPLLDLGTFVVRLAGSLAETTTPGWSVPSVTIDERVKTAVRDLLRHGGFKPAGRSKPASEYLAAAAADGRFPRINALVDACNLASLESGLPISLVDLDRTEGALAVRIAPAGTSYPFNPAGQVIDVSGLVCLYDAVGVTGTAVKDAQRTKTHDGTRNALGVVWGTTALPGLTARTTARFRALVGEIEGAEIGE